MNKCFIKSLIYLNVLSNIEILILKFYDQEICDFDHHCSLYVRLYIHMLLKLFTCLLIFLIDTLI